MCYRFWKYGYCIVGNVIFGFWKFKVDEEGYVDGKDEFVDKEYWDDEVEVKDWGFG